MAYTWIVDQSKIGAPIVNAKQPHTE